MKIWHVGFGMGQFAETLRAMIPFEQRAHSRLLTGEEANLLHRLADRKANRKGYQAAQVKA